MLDYGSSNSLPARYRIALAISLALFLHTLGLSAIPLLPEPTEQPTPTMTIALLPAGSEATPETSASLGATHAEAAVTNTATVNSRQERHRVTPEPASTTSPPANEPPQAAETAPQATPSPPTAAGAPSDSPAAESRRDIVQMTEAPKETDAYVIRLATRVAHELKRSRIPALRKLTAPVAMEMELHLLNNGALIKADVSRTSGTEAIDGAAYRAALAASPYPEPPAREGGQRYRVELLFSPERLEN
ncbi:MAG: TonB C-terminal domain-containing protein [Marinobacter sp.]|nr:TonB C-terminal domain-containing protein [Marinobacter sp.]